jgi:hypothetical protein
MLMKWYNEPPYWEQQESLITVKTGSQTDFWRRPDHGYVRDNGNFYYLEISGNFTAQVKIIDESKNLYGQAGLMIRVNENTWLKSTIEFVDGMPYLSTVVTHECSDWSFVPLLDNPGCLWLRLQRKDTTIEVQYSFDGTNYTLLKTAYLAGKETVQVGLVSACPEGEGCQITFENFLIEGESD